MSSSQPICEALTIEAFTLVLECDASTLRTDTQLSALGVDSVALVLWADVVERALRREHGFDVVVPDSLLRGVNSLGDLAERLVPIVDAAIAHALGASR